MQAGVCIALNNELPTAMDAAGIAATIRIRKSDPKSAKPSTLKEDAATIGAKYVVAVGKPNGFAGYQQYQPSVAHDRREKKWRSAIEPTVGHIEGDGKFGRNWLASAGGCDPCRFVWREPNRQPAAAPVVVFFEPCF